MYGSQLILFATRDLTMLSNISCKSLRVQGSLSDLLQFKINFKGDSKKIKMLRGRKKTLLLTLIEHAQRLALNLKSIASIL
jgi:hypothetical protein